MKNYLFIKSSSEALSVPASGFSHAEITASLSPSAGAVNIHFRCFKNGKEATVTITLSITASKEAEFLGSFCSQLGSDGGSKMLTYDAVKGAYFTSNVLGITAITTTIAR